jgi:hypothetical protein
MNLKTKSKGDRNTSDRNKNMTYEYDSNKQQEIATNKKRPKKDDDDDDETYRDSQKRSCSEGHSMSTISG